MPGLLAGEAGLKGDLHESEVPSCRAKGQTRSARWGVGVQLNRDDPGGMGEATKILVMQVACSAL